MNKDTIIALLRQDVVPALGCTEPVCVALSAAAAAKNLPGRISNIEVTVNAGIYKNGMSAGIPGSRRVGLAYAAALGAGLKNPEKSLQLLEDVTEEIARDAANLTDWGYVRVTMDPDQKGLYVRCRVRSNTDEGICVIRNAHTNIVHLEKNGEVLLQTTPEAAAGADFGVVEQLKEMTLAQIRALVEQCSGEELAFLMDGVAMNETLADYSREHTVGVGIADALRGTMGSDLLPDGLLSRILLQVASAAESRLDGCPLATMSSSGAGTKGLVVILPVSETARALGASQEQTVKALAFAHLVNRYINAHIGKLSPMCSCVMASSTAACAAICLLLGGNDQQIAYAVRNMCGTVTGMICDGGKVGCALKVATGSSAAVLCAVTAVRNAALRITDGICAETAEDCIRNMARIGAEGMEKMDRTILSIMEEKQK